MPYSTACLGSNLLTVCLRLPRQTTSTNSIQPWEYRLLDRHTVQFRRGQVVSIVYSSFPHWMPAGGTKSPPEFFPDALVISIVSPLPVPETPAHNSLSDAVNLHSLHI